MSTPPRVQSRRLNLIVVFMLPAVFALVVSLELAGFGRLAAAYTVAVLGTAPLVGYTALLSHYL